MANKKDLRGGIVKMREVAQLLSGWADDMERSLEAEKKKESVAADAPADVPAGTPAAEAVTEVVAAEVGSDAAAASAVGVPAASVAPAAPLPAADAVRAELAAKCAAGFRAQVQALINSFGAAKFSEVAPEHYPALLEAVAVLGGDGHAG